MNNKFGNGDTSKVVSFGALSFSSFSVLYRDGYRERNSNTGKMELSVLLRGKLKKTHLTIIIYRTLAVETVCLRGMCYCLLVLCDGWDE